MMKRQDISISIENVYKHYKLYSNNANRVKETFHPFRKKYSTIFHALKNVTAEIYKGETVGIVGRNGCGKSTLLQLVCGIMPPSRGSVQVDGRISAILELGAGFNPEFTGRENIYVNCSILGIERDDVDERLDAILGFADIGPFIDQPVKTYSSGMTVRLAFSIAINVDPAILIIDEALAVGDAAFQRKCFAKINSIQEGGATILFVSHSGDAIVELCDRAILLDHGELLHVGKPKDVVTAYHELLFAPPEKVDSVRAKVVGKLRGESAKRPKGVTTGPEITHLTEEFDSSALFNPHLIPKSTTWYSSNGAVISEPHIQTSDGEKVNNLVRGEEYFYTYKVDFNVTAFKVKFCMLIKTLRGIDLGGYGNQVHQDERFQMISKGSCAEVKLKFKCALLPGQYFLNAGVLGIRGEGEEYLHRGIDVAMFEVMPEEGLCATVTVDFDISPSVSISS